MTRAAGRSGTIMVAGEALIDLISDDAGTLTPVPGGVAFNVARIVARLGTGCSFLGRVSDDQYGQILSREITEPGVQLVTPAPVHAPTTLAVAQLDAGGAAEYRFYMEGTSAAALSPNDIPPGLFDDCSALALGGLSIVFEPARSTLLELVKSIPASTVVLLDPNCRPHSVADLERYRHTVAQLLTKTDIVKVSVEDLEFLSPGRTPVSCAAEMVAQGIAVVVITDGPNPCTVVTGDSVRTISVPPVKVIDTIGAGDAVVAGLLSWLAGRADVDPRAAAGELWLEGVGAALEVAAAVCANRGSALPEGFTWSQGGQEYGPVSA